QVLGTPPVLGRAFTAEEDQPNAPKVAVLSYGLWKRRFGGSSDVLGKTVQINSVPYTIVGAAAPQMDMVTADVWAPLAIQINPNARRNDFLRVFARLKP